MASEPESSAACSVPWLWIPGSRWRAPRN